MPIYNGTNEITQIFYGTNEISEVYYGTNLVWSGFKCIDLGSAQSFNVASIYSKYGSLTVNNFYYLTMDTATGSDTERYPDHSYLRLYGWLRKSYNASTGVFTSCHYVNEDSSAQTGSNVRVVLVTDPSKLTLIGTGQTFNIKSMLSNYASLTANNFIIQANASQEYLTNTSMSVEGRYSITGTRSLEKSYNASTGVLTCRYKYNCTGLVSESSTGNTTVYYISKLS